ncbi:hypothetical protein Y032_0908g2991 [Ancylostoma ceylanicum]|uniref:Uncharacterized protein n=1 Tax=Ancylostoma ceylanicum TaxID=53326 RepID=A0A016W9M5_9BILA|nr:hypothetical protein Y032_0908g2991 [Ancylostoma ceylanicum]
MNLKSYDSDAQQYRFTLNVVCKRGLHRMCVELDLLVDHIYAVATSFTARAHQERFAWSVMGPTEEVATPPTTHER